MSAPFNSHIRKRRPTINITSLIDVMFLLLIFFMVSSTFRTTIGIDVTMPQAETASEQELTPHELVVSKEGEYFLGDSKLGEAELKNALAALLVNEPEATIVLRADEAADFGRVLRAIDIARSVRATKLVIPTRYLEPESESGETKSPESSGLP